MYKRISISVLLLAFFLSAQAHGFTPQDPPDEDTIKMQHLKPIMITAQKRAKALNDIPVSISTLRAENISTAGTQSVREISAHIPNLFIPDYGMKMSAPVIIRGIGSKLSSPTVGLYVDGISYFEKESFSFELFDIKRVEVLRGPQGTLFGRNALGGIINIVTKKPSNDHSLTLKGTYGSHNLQRYQFSGNTPIIKDKLFFRAAGNFTSRDGYFKNIQTGNKIDFQEDFNGRFQLRFTPSSNLNLLYSFEGNITNDGGYPYKLADTVYQDDPYAINYDGESYFKRDFIKNSLKAEYEFSNMMLSSVSGLQTSNYEQKVDQDFRPVELVYVQNNQEEKTFTQEFNLKSKGEQAFNWVVGAFGFYQDLYNDVNVSFGKHIPYTHNISKENQRYNKGAALYGELSMHDILPNVNITLGTRYDIEEGNMNYREDSIGKDATSKLLKTSDTSMISNAFLPKISINFNKLSNQNIYFSASKGYRAGGFNTTASTGQAEKLSYEPEFTWNYELGMKGKLPNANIRYNLALFYIDWYNQQIRQLRKDGEGSIIKNAGHSYSQGAEAEISTFVLNNLGITLGAGYTEAKFIEHKDPVEELDYSGNRVPMVPEFTGNLALDYTIPLNNGWLKELKLGGNIRGVGTHYWDEANELKQPAYALFNSEVTLKTKAFNLTLWGKNLADKRYDVYKFNAFNSNYHQYGSPRILGASLSVHLIQ